MGMFKKDENYWVKKCMEFEEVGQTRVGVRYRVRTVHEKTDRTQYPSFRPQFRPIQGPIQNSLDYQGTHAESKAWEQFAGRASECVT